MNVSHADFHKYFNKYFWKAFKEKVLFYKSSFDKEEIVDSLWKDLQERRYYPSIPKDIIYKEKANWVPRIIPVFEIKDYCLYYFCIKQLEDRIARNRTPNTFWWWSLGWSIRQSEENEINEQETLYHEFEDEMANYYDVSVSQYSFNPRWWSKAYGDFNWKLKTTIESGIFDYCVEFDISNFYDNINLELLEIAIREITDIEDRQTVAILFHFLQYWNRRNNFYTKSTVWIPQDALADCSRILANFYLQRYDEYIYKICDENFRYFRYADDQFIFGNSHDELKDKILQASIFLNKIWLSINPKKVKYWKVEELLEHRSFKLFDLVSEENITPENITLFIKEVILLYQSNKFEDLKNKWISLLNKAIILDIAGLDLWDKTYLKWLFLMNSYLIQSKTFQLEKIYKLLSNEEKNEFLIKLIAITRNYKYNDFHYVVLQFFENQEFPTNELQWIIQDLNSYY